MIDAEPLEALVESYARTRLADPRVWEAAARLRTQDAEVLQALGATDARIAELEGQLDTPGVSVAVLMRAIDRAREHADELRRMLAEGATPAVPGRGEWPEDLRRRRRLVDIVVRRVTIGTAKPRLGRFDPGRVHIDAAG